MQRARVGLAATLVWWAVLASGGSAHADCANGATYRMSVTMNTVTICPTSTSRSCGSSIDLLRQNTDDGSVVVVGNACASDGSGCYVDQCVAPGTYRYGYATPYDCSEAGCGSVALFSQAQVTTTLSAGCTPASPAPAPTTQTPPWPSGAADANVSRFKMCDSGGCAISAPSDRIWIRTLNGLGLALGLALIARRAGASRRR